MKKITIRVLLSVLLVAVVAMGGTLAYLYATDSPLLNTFALADVHTEIDEPDTDVAENKDPKVQNVGKSPVYVRARAVISGGDADVIEANGWITIQYNSQKWVYSPEDDFYYYMGILQPREGDTGEYPATEELFANVKVDSQVSPKAEFYLDVYQESVLAPADAEWKLEDAQAAFAAKG